MLSVITRPAVSPERSTTCVYNLRKESGVMIMPAVPQMASDSTETSEAGEEEEEHEGDNDNKERMPFIQ